MSKILVLADIHGKLDALRQVLGANGDADLVLVAGDLTNFGGGEVADAVLAELLAAAPSRRIALVPGNCDPPQARRRMEESGLCVDGRSAGYGICRVAGVGGGLRRAGITSYERTETELSDCLAAALKSATAVENEAPLIVLTHSPPYGTNADRVRYSHSGSEAFARLMTSTRPAAWICGHIHESPCVSLEDGCLVVNPGPCAAGRYAVLRIQEGPDGPKLAGAFLAG